MVIFKDLCIGSIIAKLLLYPVLKFTLPNSTTRHYVPPDMLQCKLYSITCENFLPKILSMKLIKSLDLASTVKRKKRKRKKTQGLEK